MAKLTAEMKDMLAKQLAVIATASKNGVPNVGPKGSLFVVDDETLVYSESTAEKTLRNLKENPHIAVFVVDREKSDGYQFKGTTEFLSEGDLFQKVTERQKTRGRPIPKLVVKIRIEEIYSIKQGKTAQRIA